MSPDTPVASTNLCQASLAIRQHVPTAVQSDRSQPNQLNCVKSFVRDSNQEHQESPLPGQDSEGWPLSGSTSSADRKTLESHEHHPPTTPSPAPPMGNYRKHPTDKFAFPNFTNNTSLAKLPLVVDRNNSGDYPHPAHTAGPEPLSPYTRPGSEDGPMYDDHPTHPTQEKVKSPDPSHQSSRQPLPAAVPDAEATPPPHRALGAIPRTRSTRTPNSALWFSM